MINHTDSSFDSRSGCERITTFRLRSASDRMEATFSKLFWTVNVLGFLKIVTWKEWMAWKSEHERISLNTTTHFHLLFVLRDVGCSKVLAIHDSTSLGFWRKVLIELCCASDWKRWRGEREVVISRWRIRFFKLVCKPNVTSGVKFTTTFPFIQIDEWSSPRLHYTPCTHQPAQSPLANTPIVLK